MEDYIRSIKATGAKVISSGEFGDYQGSWYALINYNNQDILVGGGYGSCSGCDAFEDEFGSKDDETPEKLKKFGMIYVNDPLDLENEIKSTKGYTSWDIEAKDKLNWLLQVKKYFHNKDFNEKFFEN